MYTKTTVMDCDELRQFCIKNKFYTKGDCEAYSKLFDMAKAYKGDVDDMVSIAEDIYNHSDGESLTTFCYSGTAPKAIICDLMTEIERICVCSWYD